MKIWPTSILTRALRLLVSNSGGIAAFMVFLWAFSFAFYSIKLIPETSGLAYLVVTLISFCFGLYVIPAISRVFIRYLLLLSSGQTLTKQIVYKEIQPDNSVRFIFLNLIVGLPFIGFWLAYYFYINEIAYMTWAFGPFILGLIYAYSRIFMSQIVMVDLTATIDQSLKKAIQISKEYPINSLLVTLAILVLTSINLSYIQSQVLLKLGISSTVLTELIMSLIRLITNMLIYVIAVAFYLEIKKHSHTAGS